jgi:RING finger family protein/SWIM zinc finger
VLDRKRRGTPECPEEKVEMTGSTGNIYTVHIKQVPTCTCPHYQKGNQCKHWMWVMSRVLRAEFKHVYQLALLSEELREIFAKAPPIEGPGAAADKNRKPVEGDCPICYSELEEKGRKDNIVWCQAACGNNIHKHCFETWAKTKRGSDVTCPLCRSVWQGDQDIVKRIQKNRPVNSDGYVNVADQLGISQHRGVYFALFAIEFWISTDTGLQIPARTPRGGTATEATVLLLISRLHYYLVWAGESGQVAIQPYECMNPCLQFYECFPRNYWYNYEISTLGSPQFFSRSAFIFASSSSFLGTLTTMGTVTALSLRSPCSTTSALTHVHPSREEGAALTSKGHHGATVQKTLKPAWLSDPASATAPAK